MYPEMGGFAWIPAFGSVDSMYRIGTPYDLLLELRYGWQNPNQSPDGLSDEYDYIVTTQPGELRYSLAEPFLRLGPLSVYRAD